MNAASPNSTELVANPSSSDQPRLGLRGLLLVVPIAVLLALGAGAERSTLVLAPLITYALPLVAMVAFWWAGWPGSRLVRTWSGWADTALIAAGAVILTGFGQTVVGRLDPVALFDPSLGHEPTFPQTLPLGGAVFVTMLQITLVGEGWPLHRLHRLPAGLVALSASWAVGLLLYTTVVRVHAPVGSGLAGKPGLVDSPDFGAALILVAAWQVLVYVLWRGWPFSAISERSRRLPVANVSVLVGGTVSFLAVHALVGVDDADIGAVAGCFIAAGLMLGMMFEDWLPDRLARQGLRTALLIVSTLLAAMLAVVLYAVAGTMRFARVSVADWVEHASLNALSTSIILHVAIGRRWPFAATSPQH